MCWFWLAFISLGGYGKVSFVSGSAIVSHAFASCAGQPLLFWLGLGVPRTTQAASPVFV